MGSSAECRWWCCCQQGLKPAILQTRSQDSDDILVLVDSEDDDDDEGNGEEDTRGSSTKHEVMALVNGNSIQAAYLNCPTEGDEGEQPSGVPLQRTSGEDARGT